MEIIYFNWFYGNANAFLVVIRLQVSHNYLVEIIVSLVVSLCVCVCVCVRVGL